MRGRGGCEGVVRGRGTNLRGHVSFVGPGSQHLHTPDDRTLVVQMVRYQSN